MNSNLILVLNTQPDQYARLRQLQIAFAAACNTVAPVARENRCWSRVALHHLVYRDLRELHPQLGSQMACNVIYSVARTYRAILNNPLSPWNLQRGIHRALPVLNFLDDAPVYFDRHTLSVRGKIMSMFSLDGRLKFELNVSEEDARRFGQDPLREIVLRQANDRFVLQFLFATGEETKIPPNSDLPEYVIVTEPTLDAPVVQRATASLA